MIGSLEAWTSDAAARARHRGLVESVSVKVTIPKHAGGGFVIDFDGDRTIGQFVVWPNGALEASAVEIDTEDRFYFKNVVSAEMEELNSVFDELVRVLSNREAR